MKFICIGETNKEQAKNNLSKSMHLLGIDLLNCFFKKQEKNFEYKMPITISYYFNDEQNDFVETYTNHNLTYFIRNKLYNVDSFIDNSFKNKINKKIIIPNRNETNKGNLNFIINLFWPHCKMGNYFKYFFKNGFFNIFYNNDDWTNLTISEKELPFDKNMISFYLEKTAENYLEPNYDNFLYSIRNNIKEFFNDYLYPLILFNFNLCCFIIILVIWILFINFLLN